MGTKRVGWARIRSLINENTGSFHFKTPPVVNRFDLGAQITKCPQSDGSIFEGAAGETNQWTFRCGNTLSVVAIGTQTLLGPLLATNGLDVSGDQTNNDGWEFRGKSSLAMGRMNKDWFEVGESPAFYARCKFSIADVSGIDDLRFGFAEVEAFTATTDNYTDAAWMSVISGDIKTQTILANASTVATDLTAPSSGDFADGATHSFEIRVSATGVVTYLLDDETPTGAIAYTFADGTEVTPMWFHRHDSDVGGAIVWQSFEFGLQAGSITNAALDVREQ